MRRTRGVVLAGGSGSRLYPLTKTTNKHLLPVGDVPMVYHPVRRLVEAGIEDVLVVTGVDHVGAIVNQLGSGAEFGCRFSYKVQDRAGGIAEALGLAEDFASGGRTVVVLGDNVFDAPLAPHIAAWEASGKSAMILLKSVADSRPFGAWRTGNFRCQHRVDPRGQDGVGRAVGILVGRRHARELSPRQRVAAKIHDQVSRKTSRTAWRWPLLRNSTP